MAKSTETIWGGRVGVKQHNVPKNREALTAKTTTAIPLEASWEAASEPATAPPNIATKCFPVFFFVMVCMIDIGFFNLDHVFNNL